ESIVAEGCILEEATIEKSVIGIRSHINKGTVIKHCVINGNDMYARDDRSIRDASVPPLGIGTNCRIENAIIDKNARIGNNVQILNTNNTETADSKNYSIRDGIVVVHKGGVIPDNTVI
ncbi:MAG: glucose-1-phosphate adenylyltransferase, partial [Candidatus Omnitrophica bacterium]|nr:glucose-1-phosphate adenylyltransferase [Candidatus Omnitrophota bacterium]